MSHTVICMAKYSNINYKLFKDTLTFIVRFQFQIQIDTKICLKNVINVNRYTYYMDNTNLV